VRQCRVLLFGRPHHCGGWTTGANALAAGDDSRLCLTRASPITALIVIDTEQHFDHIGGNGYFRERGYRPSMATSVIERNRPGVFGRRLAEYHGQNREFPCAAPRGERSRVLMPARLWRIPNRPIHQDMTMGLGRLPCRNSANPPAHTPTNVCLYVPRDRVLFCGDCLINGYTPKPRLRDEGRMAAVACSLWVRIARPSSRRRCARARPSRDGKRC